jgi:Carboxypeptidase regulatory-like domain
MYSSESLLRLVRKRFSLLIVIIFLVSLTHLAAAQGRATVFGTVTDPSGSVVSDAQITLTNTDTNQTQQAVSAKDGTYVIAAIMPGNYSLRVQSSGFEVFAIQKMVLEVDENRRVSPQMTLGSVSEQITVNESPGQVDTREATLTQVIDAARVKDLPLNGRNPLDLQTLVAGAGGSTDLNGQQQNTLISINGGRFDGNNYTLDGVDNEDPFFNSPSVMPNPDALDQFSIKTSNYGAQEGRGSGAQINALIRSGTNQFHGSLFEYLRNSALDATPYTATAPAPYHQNQFGGSVGGPILPNKLFFFFSYQRTLTIANPNALTLIVPSAAERAGNFAEMCPAGFNSKGTCTSTATGNEQLTIPGTKTNAPYNNLAAYMYSGSINFMNALVPAPNGPNNTYVYTPHTYANGSQYIGRLDSTLGKQDTLSGHLIWFPSDDLSDQTPTLNLPGFLQTVNYTNWHVAINETHTFTMNLINVATFGYNNIVRHQVPVIPGDASWTGFGSGIVKADPSGPKGFDTKVPTYFNAFASWPLDQFRHEYQFSDLVSWTHKDHTLSFGGDLRQDYARQSQYFQGDAQVLFAASYTGNQLADFLVGHPNQILQNSMNEGIPHNLTPDLFAQDDWKATPNLTLNLGIRWEPYIVLTDELGRLSQFRPGQQSTVYPQAPVGVVFPGDAGVPPSTFSNHWAQFSPRVGFAWNVFGDGKTSLRAGAGMYYANIRTQSLNNESLNQPFAYTSLISKPAGGLANPYTSVGGSPYPFVPPTAGQTSAYKFTLPVSIDDNDPNFRAGRSDQWNVNVQQQLPGNMVSTVAYVGNTGEHQFILYEANPGIYSQGGMRRYAPTFNSIQRNIAGGHSTYHALQATLNKRLSKGITLLANYTWSKALDNGTVETQPEANPFNFSDNRGPSDADLRHVFVASGIWKLPSLHVNRLVDATLGGWEINGIWQMQSGANFTIVSGVDNSMSAVNLDRADQISYVHINRHGSRAAQMAQYFDPTAFTVNAPGTFGNTGRNEFVGPGSDLVTLGVVKELASVENWKVLFRAEFFNALNHPVLDNPTANVSSPQNGQINAAGDPRVGQVALRIEF